MEEQKKVQEKANQLQQTEIKLTQNQQSQQQIEGLGNVLEKLGLQIGLQGLGDAVPSYSGNPKQLNRWLKSIENYVVMLYKRVECKCVAFRTAKLAVSDFIHRYIDEHVGVQWQVLKEELHDRFGEHLDMQIKLLKLPKYTQHADQGVQVFAEVLLGKAQEVYGAGELHSRLAQAELVGIFAQKSKYPC